MLNSQKVPEHSWISIHGKISCSRSFHGTRGLQRDPGPGIDFWTLFWDRDRILKTVTLIYLENTFLRKLCQEQNFGVSLNFGSRAFKVLKTGHYNLRSFFFWELPKRCADLFQQFLYELQKKKMRKKNKSRNFRDLTGIPVPIPVRDSIPRSKNSSGFRCRPCTGLTRPMQHPWLILFIKIKISNHKK